MQFQAILFDMDGTLVPMDQEAFVKAYFSLLGKELCPLGIAPDMLFRAVWGGTDAMVKNDGARLNIDVFWDTFSRISGLDHTVFKPTTDSFYTGSFHLARAATQPNPLAAQAVRLARKKAPKVALATNPLFPMDAQRTRMSWVGLSETDFDLVTSYETDRFCKPNPDYYLDVCRRLGVSPADCLMIGNDEDEDIAAAASLGMSTFLVTDCRIASKKGACETKQGTFEELIAYLAAL